MEEQSRNIIGIIALLSILGGIAAGVGLYATYGEMKLLFILISVTSGAMIALIGTAAVEKFIRT